MNPTLAIIGGSEAHTILPRFEEVRRLSSQRTPFGDSQPIFRVRHAEAEFFFLPRHGEKAYSVAAPWVNYRANIYALKDLGVERVVAWSGPGAIRMTYSIGQFVVPHDLIDETRQREGTFFEGKNLGFVRQNPVFCPHLRGLLVEGLRQLRLPYAETGVYVCTEGPRLETAAEVRKFSLLGGDLVGMTLCPEVFLARELEMCYASLCYVTNYAEGVRSAPFEPGRLFEGLASASELEAVSAAVAKFPAILSTLSRLLVAAPRHCPCPRLMERYRKRGDVGPDWKTWVKRE